MANGPIDWEAIRTEYATGATSQRKLAAKYGVSPRSIARHARAEGWQADVSSVSKNVSEFTGTQGAALAKCQLSMQAMQTWQVLMQQINDAAMLQAEAPRAGTLDRLTASMERAQRALGIRFGQDADKMQAEIDKLRREAEAADQQTGGQICVAIEGGSEAWME